MGNVGQVKFYKYFFVIQKWSEPSAEPSLRNFYHPKIFKVDFSKNKVRIFGDFWDKIPPVVGNTVTKNTDFGGILVV